MPELRPAGLIGSVERALGVLQAIAACGNGANAKTVARQTELPLPSTYRMLGTLHYHGYLIRHDDGSYGLGEQLAALYESWYRKLDLDPVVRLVLRDIHKRTGLAAYFGRLRNQTISIADIVDSPERPRAPYGAARLHSVGHRSALGQALLSTLSEVDLKLYLRDHLANARFTHVLDTVRRTGVAVEVGDFLSHVASIAVPVNTTGGTLYGALAVSLPAAELPDRHAEVELALRQCAVTLAKLLA